MKYGKRDANHAEIAATFRNCGWSVADTADLGGGFPDLVVGYQTVNYLIEVKDGSRPPSQRKLTAAETEFMRGWSGQYVVICSFE